MIKIIVEYSPYTESVRIAHVLEGIYNNFYLRNNWYVIRPNGNNNTKQSTVYLPELRYERYNIEEIIKKSSQENFLFDEHSIIEPIEKDIKKELYFKDLGNTEMKKLHAEYKKVVQETLNRAVNVIEYLKDKDFLINIYPTNFGTCGSFTKVSLSKLENKTITIDLFNRLDQPAENIKELIVSAITRGKVIGKWENTEAVSDFLTKHVFGYTEHYPTIRKIRKTKPKLLEQSIKYLREINLPTGELLETKNNKIMLLGRDITDTFSIYEKRALIKLLENINQAMSFDGISEAMYKSKAEIKFTLWGITKTIQRIRDKLQRHGVPRDTIKNIKGEGFVLVQK